MIFYENTRLHKFSVPGKGAEDRRSDWSEQDELCFPIGQVKLHFALQQRHLEHNFLIYKQKNFSFISTGSLDTKIFKRNEGVKQYSKVSETYNLQ